MQAEVPIILQTEVEAILEPAMEIFVEDNTWNRYGSFFLCIFIIDK